MNFYYFLIFLPHDCTGNLKLWGEGGTNIGNLDLKLQSPLPSPLSPPLLHFPHEKENNNSNTKTDTIQSANIVQIQKIKDSFLVGNWRHLSFVKISTLVWVVLLDQN